MKHQKSDIRLLLTLLLVFSGIVGFLHGDKRDIPAVPAAPTMAPETTVNKQPEPLTISEIHAELVPLMESRATNYIAQIIISLPAEQFNQVLTFVINDKITALKYDDRIKVIGYLLESDTLIDAAQETIFSLIKQLRKENSKRSDLYVLADAKYVKAVQKIHKKFSDATIDEQAYESAVDKNTPEVFNTLQLTGVSLTKEGAKRLMWKVIGKGVNPQFIAYLIQAKAPLEEEYQDGKTPLLYAVEKGNLLMVNALLKAGAKVETMIKPEIGTALQQAQERRLVPIEMALREALHTQRD